MPAPETQSPESSPHLDSIFNDIQGDLDRVEQIIRDKVESHLGLVESSSRYLYRSGGKRVRPALLLLAARACGYRGDKGPQYAAVTEFIHTATLVHDDIVDEATMRRGHQSLNALLGNDFTVLLGDFLYIRSIALAIEMGSLQILEVICEITLRMIEGMILELTRGGAVDLSEEEHLDILKRKTAYLFLGCGQMGAILGEASDDVREAMADYGMNLGMAFQVADDLLDFTADEEVLGKPVLSDLKEGHVTLPIIYSLQAEPRAIPTVQAVLERRAIDDVSRKEILDLVRRNRTLERVRAVAQRYALAAQERLSAIPESSAKDALDFLTQYVIDRNR
ncbi:MAG TPA: polyprenyl synthetase family protein [Vicinamibacteria bacterium]|nr:polyprenyl synthetase family protein [Vicinamibacteria bacterium]